MVAWPSGLTASFVVNRLPTQPGLRPWVQVPEPQPQAGTPRLPGPDGQDGQTVTNEVGGLEQRATKTEPLQPGDTM